MFDLDVKGHLVVEDYLILFNKKKNKDSPFYPYIR